MHLQRCTSLSHHRGHASITRRVNDRQYKYLNMNVIPSIKTDRKTHQCAYCQKTFTRSNYKIVHEKIHTKEKLYYCVFCDKTFSQSIGKTLHERIHTNEKPYQCAYCETDKCFSQLGIRLFMKGFSTLKINPTSVHTVTRLSLDQV